MVIMNKLQFYARIEQLLEQNNWSWYRLSQESGIAVSTIYNMKERKSEPKMETFLKLVDGFHISVEQFVDISYIPKTYTGKQIELIELVHDLADADMERVLAYAQGIIDKKNGN